MASGELEDGVAGTEPEVARQVEGDRRRASALLGRMRVQMHLAGRGEKERQRFRVFGGHGSSDIMEG